MTRTWNPLMSSSTIDDSTFKSCLNSVYGLPDIYNNSESSSAVNSLTDLTGLTGYKPAALYTDDYFNPYARNDVFVTNEAAREMIGLRTKNKSDFKEENKMAIKKIIFADNKNKTILFTSDCSYQRKTIVTKSPNETAFVNDADLIRFAYVKSIAPKSTWEVISEIPIPEDEESQHRLVKKLEKAFLSRSRYLRLERELKYIFFEMPAKKRESVIVYQNRK